MEDKTMASVLIASLGESPGVITALVDALIDKDKKIERVIPIYTKDTALSTDEPIQIRELEKEFGTRGWYKGKIAFDYKGKHVAGKDIGSITEKGYASSDDFFRKAIEIIDNTKKEGHEVIVGIGGGRKTMSALMTYAALIKDVQDIYQIMVSNHIESIGKYYENSKWDKKDQALHPKPNERWLVKLPNIDEIDKIREDFQTGEIGVIHRPLEQPMSALD
jgi:CRISPR-associated protein (TIGR02584 family)